jgi:hypothetical protein
MEFAEPPPRVATENHRPPGLEHTRPEPASAFNTDIGSCLDTTSVDSQHGSNHGAAAVRAVANTAAIMARLLSGL